MTDLGPTYILADATREDVARMAGDFTPQDEADGGGWMPLLMFFGAGFLAALALVWFGMSMPATGAVAAFGSAIAALTGMLFRSSRPIPDPDPQIFE